MNEEKMEEIMMETDIYSSQIKIARDSSRITDLNALRAWIEQVYQETWSYPSYDEFRDRLSIYIYSIPKDSLDWEVINWCEFWYKYVVWTDNNWIKNQIFRLSTCFEDEWNIKSRAKNDWWIYDNKYEIWVWIYNDFWEWKFLRDLE